MSTAKGNVVIAQSGGPSMVINQSLVGAILEARRQSRIGKILGSRHGIQGLLKEDLVDLRRESTATLEAVAATPSSALGSVRKKPTPEECGRIFEALRKYGIRYLFYIGGNDSAETAHILASEAARANYELCCFHIPKTIDNDLLENDHTPGYGSAARFVALALMGDNLDNRALPGVKIDVIMGREAGFLTAASALARVYPDDGPHLIYLPEVPFDEARFVEEVREVMARHGRCLVAVSEGLKNPAGQAIVSAYTRERDSHNNVQLSGTGALGDLLAETIRLRSDISRVRADTLGYLQRSFPGVVSAVDAREARAVGRRAVQEAMRTGESGSIGDLPPEVGQRLVIDGVAGGGAAIVPDVIALEEVDSGDASRQIVRGAHRIEV